MKISVQLYTVLRHITNETALAETLRKLKAIGYDYVQYLDVAGLPAGIVKELCDSAGLKISSSHCDFDDMFNNTEKYAEMCRLWQCPYIGTGSMPERFRETDAGYREFAEMANRLGERFRKEGIQFTYHNHWFEFKDFGGYTGFDILTNETLPENLQFEVDVCWAKYAGCDPVKLLTNLSGRIGHLHFKDLRFKNDGSWETVEVGSGILNWAEIAKAAVEGGAEFAAVEQDVCPGDPFESLEKSFEFIKTLNIK